VGMFTEKDVLRAILPGRGGAQAGKPLDESDPLGVKNRVEQLSRNTVGELMRRDVIKLSEETPVSEAAHIMLVQNVRRVPVVDAQERLRGIIARSDVMTALLKQE
jgi:CBS domain-containing protein